MKLKLDENLPESSVTELSQLGHDVDNVRWESLMGHTDADVWNGAQKTGRILITQDLDFSDVRQFAPGTLCSQQISQAANVSVAPNASRGGIIPSPPDLPITIKYAGALVGPAIVNILVTNGVLAVRFEGEELESAPSVAGPWAGTGNTSGFIPNRSADRRSPFSACMDIEFLCA